jgi:hypothetical protein
MTFAGNRKLFVSSVDWRKAANESIHWQPVGFIWV